MGGTIDRATVSLRIFGQDLEPDELTQLLGCHPSEAHRAGDVVTTVSGRTRVIRQGSWLLNTNESRRCEIAEQIADLLRQLTANLQVWQHITTQFQADIFCGLFLDGWNRGFTLPPEVMRQLSERQLAISCDIYTPADTWDDATQPD